jgi:hypothetical protein
LIDKKTYIFLNLLPIRHVRANLRDYGKTLHVGKSRAQRESFLGRNLPLILMIEGGGGAIREALTAQREGNIVIPVGCLEGGAATFASSIDCPFNTAECKEKWEVLQNPDKADSPEEIAAAICHLIKFVFDDREMTVDPTMLRLDGRDTDAGAIWPENVEDELLRAKVVELQQSIKYVDNVNGISNFIRERTSSDKFPDGCYVCFDGHGNKNQYAGMDGANFREKMKAKLAPLVQRLNTLIGEGKWCAMYGGDPFDSESSIDMACLVHTLHHDFGVAVIAVQCELYQAALLEPITEEPYGHMRGGCVFTYPTDTVEHPVKRTKSVCFGGYHPFVRGKELIGGSAYFYHDNLAHQLKGHAFLGGGDIAKDNLDYCLFGRREVPVFYVPSYSKHAPAHIEGVEGQGWCGQVHDFILLPKIFPTLLSHKGYKDVVKRLLPPLPDSHAPQQEMVWEFIKDLGSPKLTRQLSNDQFSVFSSGK